MHQADVMGQILQEVEAGQHPEWKDITDCSPIYKSYWAQWNSLVVTDSMLEHCWESVNRRTKTAQTVLPWKEVKEVLAEIHRGPSEGQLGVNTTLGKVRQ
jgi:hypothetical protein